MPDQKTSAEITVPTKGGFRSAEAGKQKLDWNATLLLTIVALLSVFGGVAAVSWGYLTGKLLFLKTVDWMLRINDFLEERVRRIFRKWQAEEKPPLALPPRMGRIVWLQSKKEGES